MDNALGHWCMELPWRILLLLYSSLLHNDMGNWMQQIDYLFLSLEADLSSPLGHKIHKDSLQQPALSKALDLWCFEESGVCGFQHGYASC